MERKRNPTPGRPGSKEDAEAEKEGMDDHPGGGSSSGSGHPRQDEEVLRPQPIGEGLIGLNGGPSASG